MPRVKRKRTRKYPTTILSCSLVVLAFFVGSTLFFHVAHRLVGRSEEQQHQDAGHANKDPWIHRRSLETKDKWTVSALKAPLDYQQFTVRINTWKREEQLQLSIQHHQTCTSVAQIQVVWCTDQGKVPAWLLALQNDSTTPPVVVELHDANSLNERFHLLSEPLTAAILSIDDDVLRPCIALDAAFVKWTRNPDRQVGFDARSHEIVTIDHDSKSNHENSNHDQTKWQYAYMSTTEKTNQYSTTLTRYSFLHRDYLHQYMTVLPQSIRDTVAANFNCEDIAMSLWISARTGNRPPLLADFWAVKLQIKMYVPVKISGGHNHKHMRNDCVNNFATVLGLKQHKPQPLVPVALYHDTLFEYGAMAEDWNAAPSTAALSLALQNSLAVIERWKGLDDPHQVIHELGKLRAQASHHILKQGLIEKSPQWNDRFHPDGETKKSK